MPSNSLKQWHISDLTSKFGAGTVRYIKTLPFSRSSLRDKGSLFASFILSHLRLARAPKVILIGLSAGLQSIKPLWWKGTVSCWVFCWETLPLDSTLLGIKYGTTRNTALSRICIIASTKEQLERSPLAVLFGEIDPRNAVPKALRIQSHPHDRIRDSLGHPQETKQTNRSQTKHPQKRETSFRKPTLTLWQIVCVFQLQHVILLVSPLYIYILFSSSTSRGVQ